MTMEQRHNTRAEWATVPADIRAAVERLVGSPIREAFNAAGGFSPGPAARCTLADGSTVFVKACGSELNSFTPSMHRREALILRDLPPPYPVPRLIGVVDDGDWVALVIEHIAGRMPTSPITEVDVAFALGVVQMLAEMGTPSPISGLQSIGPSERDHACVYSWPELAGEGLVDRLDSWSSRHLEHLIELEAGWIDAVDGTTLLHGDLRTDNILIAARATYVVDWPAAGIGAPWVDLVGLLPALHVDGGPPPAELFDRHPLARTAEPDAVDSYLSALAGYFTRQSLLPPPPGIAAVRGFQAAQGVVTRSWLAHRLALE